MSLGTRRTVPGDTAGTQHRFMCDAVSIPMRSRRDSRAHPLGIAREVKRRDLFVPYLPVRTVSPVDNSEHPRQPHDVTRDKPVTHTSLTGEFDTKHQAPSTRYSDPHGSDGLDACPCGQLGLSLGTSAFVPRETHSKRQGEGQRQGQLFRSWRSGRHGVLWALLRNGNANTNSE